MYRWGREAESNFIEVHIHHLHRKLQADVVQTVRGVAYVHNPPDGLGECCHLAHGSARPGMLRGRGSCTPYLRPSVAPQVQLRWPLAAVA